MRNAFALFAVGVVMAAGGLRAEEARQVEKPKALPLALGDDFEFRKTILYLNEPAPKIPTDQISEPMIAFQRRHAMFGALTQFERRESYGNYFTFFWRAARPADITVRLEYRQEKLGSFVMAQEISYQAAAGTHKTKFQVTGDDFAWDGPVSSWRALLIEGGKVVALDSSFLWN